MSDSISSVVLLIGLAVGVDYALFYVRRVREERAAGRDGQAAIEAAAATSGRAVLISGFTVVTAMAGMYLAGAADFSSYATGTIVVVALAMVGSLTVLPALLSAMGGRIDKNGGRLLRRVKRAVARLDIWGRITDRVLRRPVVACVAATAILVALAVPAIGMKTASPGPEALPQDLPVVQTFNRVQAAFPSENSAAVVVVQAADVTAPAIERGIERLQARTGADPKLFPGRAEVDTSPDRTVAKVTVPTAGDGFDATSGRALDALRDDIVPATLGGVGGVQTSVTGAAAEMRDFNASMVAHLPFVFGFVLIAAFALLLVTFRSIVIPIKAIVLNLLSVAAAYGVLVSVFQNEWAEGLLGFNSTGAIVPWLPLFLFVILFGLSMDYHVFILTRIREAYDRGMSTSDAVSQGIRSTAGVVTSAAVVMVAVFSIFATLSLLDFKQMGIGLAVAVLIDATLIRGVLLPATMTLLGERNWWLPRSLRRLPRLQPEGEVVPARELTALRSRSVPGARPPGGRRSFLKHPCARGRARFMLGAVQWRTDALVGRAAVLADVDRALEGLDSGPLGCLTIEGEPGIGKTRMLAELTLRAERRRGHRAARDRVGVRDLRAVRRRRRRVRRAPRVGSRPHRRRPGRPSWSPSSPRSSRHSAPEPRSVLPPAATSAIARTAPCAARSSGSRRTHRSS